MYLARKQFTFSLSHEVSQSIVSQKMTKFGDYPGDFRLLSRLENTVQTLESPRLYGRVDSPVDNCERKRSSVSNQVHPENERKYHSLPKNVAILLTHLYKAFDRQLEAFPRATHNNRISIPREL